MKVSATYIPYESTNSFQTIVFDYFNEEHFIEKYINEFPSIEAIQTQIERKQLQYIDRELLFNTFKKQYQNLVANDLVNRQIELLKSQNTFTVCTAHQPNIFTGYLYFIYKIVHTIKMSKLCKESYPAYHFIPVFYIGSEDNDIEEIGEFNYQQKHYRWQTSQRGACGRMHTQELKIIVDEIVKTLNIDIKDEKEMIHLLREAYNGTNSLAEATRTLLHSMFAKYGLLVLDADDVHCKSAFRSVMYEELFEQSSKDIVDESIQALSVKYKVQANPREINLFYLKEGLRERIEKNGELWHVLNTDLYFTKAELELELQHHPERFSPNVILRPLYQETLLPNIAVIGGGGELAYWLELKSLFDKHQLVYPLVCIRNSVLWMHEKTNETRKKLLLDYKAMFAKKEDIFFNLQETSNELSGLKKVMISLDNNLKQLIELGKLNHPQLGKSMEAHASKIKHIEQRIEQKFKAHIKRKSDITWNRIEVLKEQIAPHGHLQERYDNFLSIFKIYGFTMFDILLDYQKPFGKEFLIIHSE